MNTTSPSDSPSTRPPGQSVLPRGLWRALTPFFALLFAVGFVLGSALHPAFLRDQAAVVGLLLLAGALVFAVRRADRILERHQRGVAGEEITASALKHLPGDWRVFHGVPLGGGREADHVVLGPKGVFMIETINWTGRIRVEGGRVLDDDRFYPGYTLEELADRAARLEETWERPGLKIIPVLCVVGGRLAPTANPRQGVWFAEPHNLIAVLNLAGTEIIDESTRRAILHELEPPA